MALHRTFDHGWVVCAGFSVLVPIGLHAVTALVALTVSSGFILAPSPYRMVNAGSCDYEKKKKKKKKMQAPRPTVNVPAPVLPPPAAAGPVSAVAAQFPLVVISSLQNALDRFLESPLHKITFLYEILLIEIDPPTTTAPHSIFEIFSNLRFWFSVLKHQQRIYGAGFVPDSNLPFGLPLSPTVLEIS